jgi:hypothetical protein
MKLWELDEAIKAVCPILGVRSDKTILFKPEATVSERAAAQAIADAADLTTPTDPDRLGAKGFDEMDKTVKAALLLMRSYCNALVAGTYTTKTVAQVRTDYITAYKAIP